MKTIGSWALLGSAAFGLGLVSGSGSEAWAIICPSDGTDRLGRYMFEFDSAGPVEEDAFPSYLVGDLPPSPPNVNGHYALQDGDTHDVFLILDELN